MDEETELSVTIAQIVQRLRGTHLHTHLENQAIDCLHRPEIKLESLKEDVRDFLKASGWERKLQNAVYRELHIAVCVFGSSWKKQENGTYSCCIDFPKPFDMVQHD